jgi:hypothetical protein
MGQEPRSVAKPKPDIRPAAGETADDPRSLIDALADRNPAPKLIGDADDPVAVFDPKFDWDEYDRAWRAIPALVHHAESAWPELVRHVDDERYCTTFESVSGDTHNWTVGDACRSIIGRNLSQAYYQNLQPESVLIYSRFRWPDLWNDRKQFNAWFEARRKKKLYELQIEACEWAISELAGPDDLGDVPRAQRTAWVASIRKQIEWLRESKKAVPFPGYGDEEYTSYDKERATIETPK